jgi:hypothetical protein
LGLDRRQAALLEHRLEERPVKPLDLFATMCGHPEYIGKIGIPRKNGGKRMRIMSIPRVSHCRNDIMGRLLASGSRHILLQYDMASIQYGVRTKLKR